MSEINGPDMGKKIIVKLAIDTEDLNQVLNGTIYDSADNAVVQKLKLRKTQAQKVPLPGGKYYYFFTPSRSSAFVVQSDHKKEKEPFEDAAGKQLKFKFEVAVEVEVES